MRIIRDNLINALYIDFYAIGDDQTELPIVYLKCDKNPTEYPSQMALHNVDRHEAIYIRRLI